MKSLSPKVPHNSRTHNELRRDLARKCLDIAECHYVLWLYADDAHNKEEAEHHLGMENKYHSNAKRYIDQIK